MEKVKITPAISLTNYPTYYIYQIIFEMENMYSQA